METNIYLIRHGQTDWNKDRRFQGQKDIPLNDFGKSQAEKLAEHFYNESIKVDAIYSSDLIRAKETAEIIANRYTMNVLVHAGLRERDFGLLEGVRIDELKEKYPDFNIGNLEELESFDIEPLDIFKSRIFKSLVELSKNHINENIAVVSHGAAINTFLDDISNGILGSGKTRIVNTSFTTIAFIHNGSSWNVKEVNNISHIDTL